MVLALYGTEVRTMDSATEQRHFLMSGLYFSIINDVREHGVLISENPVITRSVSGSR